jgi:hypothetical protein
MTLFAATRTPSKHSQHSRTLSLSRVWPAENVISALMTSAQCEDLMDWKQLRVIGSCQPVADKCRMINYPD